MTFLHRIIFVYGKLIYQLLGPKAEETFISTWGVSVGLGQLSEAQDTGIAIVQTAMALTVLELLWVVTNTRWLEDTVDYMSVHATIAHAAGVRCGRSVFSAARAYSRFYKGTTA